MFNGQSGRGLLGVRVGLPDGLLGRSDVESSGSSATGLLGFGLPSIPSGNQPSWRNDGPDLAAAGDLQCQGFSAGCPNAGSWGTTATHRITGRNVCSDCAVKMLGIQTEPLKEKIETLRRFLLRAP